jgi:hypothetical protein
MVLVRTVRTPGNVSAAGQEIHLHRLATSALQQGSTGGGGEPGAGALFFSETCIVWCAQKPTTLPPLAHVNAWCRQEITCRCRRAGAGHSSRDGTGIGSFFGRYGTVLRYWPLAGTDAALPVKPMAARRGLTPAPRLFPKTPKASSTSTTVLSKHTAAAVPRHGN